jgi:hypothetical protein
MSKTYLLITFAALILGKPVHAQVKAECPAQPSTLKAMRNCYRPLLVFAPSSRDASLVAQQGMLDQYADEMMDRNLLYVPVLARGGHFESPLDAPYVVLKQAEMNAIRSRFLIGPSEFVVVLVGKDGGEKFRTKKAIAVLKLDEIVDAMPMGHQEKSVRTANTE